jgi:hypothetical protein
VTAFGLAPFGLAPFGGEPEPPPPPLPAAAARPARRGVTQLLVGELRGGRITDVIDATGLGWEDTLNAAGRIDRVTVPEHLVRSMGLRHTAAPARCFLAVETDGRIRQAGPIWSHVWDWEAGVLTLGASGLWSIFDHRLVLPVLADGQRVQDADTTISGTDLAGIARGLVAQALSFSDFDIPVNLPPAATGTRTETFPGWKLQRVGEQMRQLTERENGPDLRFRPRRVPGDETRIEWVFEHGTEDEPQLVQTGDDWVFDTTAPRSPVLGISVDQDATVMGLRAFVTGNGMERDILIARAADTTLADRGYPLLDVDEARSTVELQDTLQEHADDLLARSARPIEAWKVTVRADAALEVLPGDTARVVVRGDAYLPDGEWPVRVATIAGDLTDTATLTMYPTLAVL